MKEEKMTVIFTVGRRVPKSWYRRTLKKIGGLITFQENIWLMISQALNMAKKKANASGKMVFVMEKNTESEDMNYNIEWIKLTIQGNKEDEEINYNSSMKLYSGLTQTLKKEIPSDDNFKKCFKTKVLNMKQVDEAYKTGYGSLGNESMANKLLEMGILTHVEWVHDYEVRDKEAKVDF
jgi:hypothetical protein